MSRFPVTVERPTEWRKRAKYEWFDVSTLAEIEGYVPSEQLQARIDRLEPLMRALADATRALTDDTAPQPELPTEVDLSEPWPELEFISGLGPDVTFTLPSSLLPDITDLDLEDRDSILRFVRKFGFMGVPSYVWGMVVVRLEDGELWIRHPEELPSVDENNEQVAGFRASVGMLTACAVVMRELLAEGPFSLPRVRSDWPQYTPWPPPKSKSEAVKMLEAALNVALSYQRPAVDVESGGSVRFGWEMPPCLFAIVGIEFIEVLTEKRPIKTCANPRCNRWFHELAGGSKHRQPRRDAKYCSTTCRTATTSANYRAKGRN